MKSREVIGGGSLVVTGSNSASIILPGNRRPNEIRVHVEFERDRVPLVCNPHHHDSLEWDVRESRHRHGHKHPYELHIKWHVSGLRIIRWHLSYEE